MEEAFTALWQRYVQALASMSASGWVLGAAVGAVLVAGLIPWTRRWERFRQPARMVALAVGACFAVAWAWRLRWISDDAFISFRYARNWVEGHGLVFNPGERVEGYTNFLWTALLAAGMLLGLPPAPVSVLLGLASLAAAVLLTARIATTLSPRRAHNPIPVAALLVCTSYVFVSFGTSGLETMFAAALVLLAVERALASRPLAAGLAGIAATMAHPDHAVFYAALGAAWASTGVSRRVIARYALPLIAVYVPYFAARWLYYGSFFPNTYYAKSGGDWYLSQGLLYVTVTLLAAGLLGWLPLALFGLECQRSRVFGRFVLLGSPLYTLYVMKIGGDFMLGRLLVPLFPLAAISVEAGARYLTATKRFACAAAGVALAATSALPLRLYGTADKFLHVADERWFYQLEQLHPVRVDSPFTTWSDQLISAFGRGHDGPVVATGCIGIVSYRTGYPMLDVFGLTDPKVARQPLASRDRPGHEKRASAAYLLERGVMLTDQLVYPVDYAPWTEVLPGRVPLHLVRYEEPLVEALRKSGHPPARMDEIVGAYQAPKDQARFACDLWFFESYYFRHDRAQERRDFVARLHEADHLTARQAAVLVLPQDAMPDSWTKLGGIDFSGVDGSRWLRTGTAFGVFPRQSPPLGQTDVGWRRGPFAGSFTQDQGDAATGIAQSPPFRLEGDVVTLRVGGGKDSERLRVVLLVNDSPAAVATGCGSEILGRRVWDVAEHRGAVARIVIVDEQTANWGHIVVDEIEQWRSDR